MLSLMLENWLLTIIILGILYKLYMKSTTGIYKNMQLLDGKTVLVTGANTGIGFETAREFAQRRAKVILACRNLEKANKAKAEIISSTSNRKIVVRQVDLSSMASVRRFCREVLETEHRLDILVNNAAVLYTPEKKMTEEGLEAQMASNHFGPFLLTNLLLGLLKRTPNSRIVNVSSIAYMFASIDFENLNAEKSFNSLSVYAVSKLANILFTIELAKRLQGSGVTCNVLHPGTVNTEILRNVHYVLRSIMNFLNNIFCKTAAEGAQTTMYVSIDDTLKDVSGKYFQDCKEVKLTKKAQDPAVAKKLWEISERLVQLKPEEMHS